MISLLKQEVIGEADNETKSPFLKFIRGQSNIFVPVQSIPEPSSFLNALFVTWIFSERGYQKNKKENTAAASSTEKQNKKQRNKSTWRRTDHSPPKISIDLYWCSHLWCWFIVKISKVFLLQDSQFSVIVFLLHLLT